MDDDAEPRFPPGVPCWVDLAAHDVPAAEAFYGAVLGWAFAPGPVPGCSAALLGTRTVASISEEPGDAAGAWRTAVCVASVEAVLDRVREAGGRVSAEPVAWGEAALLAELTDPQGATLWVWEPAARGGVDTVNEAGAWNWSDLASADLDAAAAFYGAVFGWRAAPSGFGDARMWQLPGYGDHLARRDPDLRRRHAEAGVPPGFSDAIGWLLPAGAGTAPRWTVTFAVDDVDAAADAAAQTGGSVTVAPYDAGPARVAVLADPGGAAFTVSRYSG